MTTAIASPWNGSLDRLRLFSLYALSLSLFMAPAGVSAGLLLIWVWFVALLLSRAHQPQLPRHPLVWLTLAFALYGLLQALFPRMASAELMQRWEVAFSWAQLAVMVPIAYALRGEERLAQRLFLLVLMGILLGTLWRLDWALLLGDADAFFDSRPGFGFPALAYALYAGTALIGLLVLRRRCWYRHDGRLRWWALPLWLAALVMLAEGVVLTQARGSWLGLILVALLGAGLWLRGQWRRHGRIPRTPLLVAASALLLLIGLNASEIGERLNEERRVAEQLLRGEVPPDQVTSLTLRWHAQRFGFEVWQKRPWLGWGPGASAPLIAASVAALAVETEADSWTGVAAGTEAGAAAGADAGVVGADGADEVAGLARGGRASVVDAKLAAAASGIWHPEDGVIKHLHNSYLELLAQLGLVGFGLWMLIALLLLWAVYDGIRRGRLSLDVGLFLSLALLYLAVWSLFDFRMVHQDFRGYWALLAGTALSMALYRRDSVEDDGR
ncbi:O-antigen ligase family protein [Halochromatium salexigens]|uniref:O-antigen ligase family protein n=1 Tax=Halochromatium salexigens TaxID=49447 RepID=UPI001912EAE6